jgi:hypothetical protein
MQLAFFLSIALALVAWGVFSALYVWPQLRDRPRADALRPLLLLHAFRFIGLSFLVTGVVSPDLPARFAQSAAYGDLVAVLLAWLALATLRLRAGIVFVWIFNLWGTFDLLDAFFQAAASNLSPGQLGATFFIPTFAVPLMLITHGLIFRILIKHRAPAGER